jgi:arginine decarboxylase
MVPQKVFFTKGVGIHKEKLASFELALRAAGVAHCNLVLVSSIYPPGCKTIPKEEGLKLLRPGEIVFAVYDRESNNEPNRLVAASVGLAIPADSSMHGYLSEHHSFGETDEKAGEYAEDLAASMLATTLGIEFNPELDWDEREQIFKMSGIFRRASDSIVGGYYETLSYFIHHSGYFCCKFCWPWFWAPRLRSSQTSSSLVGENSLYH